MTKPTIILFKKFIGWLHRTLCIPSGISAGSDSLSVSSQSIPYVSNRSVNENCSQSGLGLANSSWLSLVEECVALFEEMEENKPFLDTSSHNLADHVVCRLQEILLRSGVEIIADESIFDRQRHQPVNRNPGAREDCAILETISPGFAVDRRVLKRAKVKLAGDSNQISEGSFSLRGNDHEPPNSN